LHVADHLNDVVAYGFPLVKQERNPHNYFADHRAEEHGTNAPSAHAVLPAAATAAAQSPERQASAAGISDGCRVLRVVCCMLHNCVAGLEFTDRFCEWLRAMPLKGTTYFQCFQEVTEGLKQCLASEPNLKPEKVAFLTGFIQAYSSLRRS
jgi:hypothetical protein